ncbi:hypothetical protein ACM758_15620 [Pseudomonas aeruginosa]
MNKANECTCPSGDGSLVHPCPAHPAVEQAGGDERAAFEAAFAAMGRPVCRADYDQDAYGTPFDDGGWTGWQARAALAQPSPKREQRLVECDACPTSGGCVEKCMKAPTQPSPAQAEAERPEVAEVAFVLRNIGAMDAEDIDGDNVDLRFEDAEGRDTGCDVSIVEYAEKAADLFEQHDRIVGALRAENAKLSEALDECDGDRWKLRSERDAANARLHEVATACATAEQERDAALARVAELEGKLTDWVHEGFRLNEALAVAKAQHSVPEGWMLVPVEQLLNMMSDKDHDTRIMAERQLLAVLAAAPSKEGL